MLLKIDHALQELLKSELGYTVDPVDIQSLQALSEDEFPVCFLHYDGEDPATDGDEDETIGYFTQDVAIDFEIGLLTDEKQYRHKAMRELSNVKKFINEFRNLVEHRYPEACVIRMQYEGMSFLGFDNSRSGGGLVVQTTIKYRQCRENPENNVCEGNC